MNALTGVILIFILLLLLWTPYTSKTHFYLRHWRHPPHVLLYAFARLTLLVMPTTVVYEMKEKKKVLLDGCRSWKIGKMPCEKRLFVANHCVTERVVYRVPWVIMRVRLFFIVISAAMHSMEPLIFHITRMPQKDGWVPVWSWFLYAMGAVPGTAEATQALMEANEPILVFPGGADEVMRRSTVQKYTLLWKQRKGFARLAVQHGYTIVPVASVGLEDELTIVADVGIPNVIWRIMGDKRRHWTIPFVWKNNLLRRFWIFVSFGREVETAGLEFNDVNVDMIREDTRRHVVKGIHDMQQLRRSQVIE